MNLYFTFEFRNCLDLFSTCACRIRNFLKPIKYICNVDWNASVQFQTKMRKISHRRSRSPKYAEIRHFTVLFCRERVAFYIIIIIK